MMVLLVYRTTDEYKKLPIGQFFIFVEFLEVFHMVEDTFLTKQLAA
ncbi:hypothetical protein HZI73_08440 [Vallitalea pronyensis]|uniref:Uncharacterized protein n=1 Tax=Vallitalea pronyensis TaxID=1348613 RepID=A0A8J8MIK9_9FIRM|nr:hypothetical protein [Vallitalea pronyensis]QUI22325.1 hypothetical protein HZI73_08440 [Vallitalea pronyensis]